MEVFIRVLVVPMILPILYLSPKPALYTHIEPYSAPKGRSGFAPSGCTAPALPATTLPTFSPAFTDPVGLCSGKVWSVQGV